MSHPAIPVEIKYSGRGPGPWPEMVPCQAGKHVWVSTDHSYIGRWSGPNEIICDRLVSYRHPEVMWRRNYAGVYSAAIVRGVVCTFLHGENKNEIVGADRWVNTVNNKTTCFSGYDPAVGGYRDCWDDYFAFCSMAKDGIDQGPIVWPHKPYLDQHNNVVSHGCRHPSSAVLDGKYLYVFYLDTSVGICVARCEVHPNLNLLRPAFFETWCGHVKRWQRSMPAVHKAVRERLHLAGPPAHPILGARQSFVFTVCKIQKGWLALELSAPTSTTVGWTVWTSENLVDWKHHPEVLWESSGTDIASAFQANHVWAARPIREGMALSTNGSNVYWIFW